MTTLREAAIAVIARWDSPLDWRNQPSTARYMEDLRTALEVPENQVLQAQCDAFLANVQLLEAEIEAMTKERDALLLAKQALQGYYAELRSDYDALLAAGKLAVKALDDWYYGANQDRPKATVYVALQALKKAGVA